MHKAKYSIFLSVIASVVLAFLFSVVACGPLPVPLQSSATPIVTLTPGTLYRAPTYAEITPGAHKQVSDLSTTIEVPPFPHSRPLPPPIASTLDGLYSKMIPLIATPTPCKRCAGYRLEGGVWTLYFDKGIFKVFHQDTGFESVGSFTVSGNRLSLFNDPYCEEDLTMVGDYAWEFDARGSLQLRVIDDLCSYRLRSKNLTDARWVKTPIDPKQRADSCQPPNREAAISDHWFKPPYCR